MKLKQFTFALVAAIPLTIIGCNKATPTLTSTIAAVKSESFVDIVIKDSVKTFKSKGFNYGDLIEFTYKDTDGQEHTHHNVPFVTNYVTAGLFNVSICDYEKAGKELTISLGTSDDYDTITSQKCLNQEITFKLEKSGGWIDTFNKIPLNQKCSYKIIGRDNNVFSNARDIKTSGDNLDNENINNDVIYRMSSPFDDLENYKRYKYADGVLGNIIGNDKSTLLIDLNYTNFINSSGEDFEERARGNIYIFPDFTTLNINEEIPQSIENKDCKISINIGDNFFSKENASKINIMFSKILKIVEIQSSSLKKHSLVFCDGEGIERPGFICLLLAALSGSNYKSLVADYMLSYKNYYNIIPYGDEGKEQYNLIKSLTVDRLLYSLTLTAEQRKNVDWTDINVATNELNKLDLEKKSFKEDAENYLKNDIGLTDEQVTAIANLTKNK